MNAVALMHWFTGTEIGRARVMEPVRVSTIELGLMEMSGLRSCPDENNFANDPSW